MRPITRQTEVKNVAVGAPIRAPWLSGVATNIRAMGRILGEPGIVTKHGVMRRPQRAGEATSSLGYFFAKIMTEGPTGQPDFDNARYWVKEYKLVATESLLSWISIDEPRWVIAVNVAELFTGTHSLLKSVAGCAGYDPPSDRGVFVADVSGTDEPVYAFDTYPGQLPSSELLGYLSASLDNDCCPEPCGSGWVNTIGPAIVSTVTCP